MTERNLRTRIQKGVFMLDGAMGTQLFARGVEPGHCNDWLNVERPDLVLDVHRAYLDAGCDAVLTNTFGANRYALGRHGYADKAFEINKAGAQVARKAAGESRYVLGDVGPTGDFLEPLGLLKPDPVREAFVEQVKGLREGGVDGLIIETMTAIEELEVAIEAAKSAGGGLPVLASMSFDKGGVGFRTMMGVDVATAVSRMIALGVDVIGFNCGTCTLEEYVELAQTYVTSAQGKVPVFAEPNAGKPELLDGQAVYRVTPEEFASACRKILDVGVHILGGCCGSTPRHIGAVVTTLKP
ncbi:MAG TPA: homocysteine S-methyltransferase family protein [Sedimentisphaerales bacterium]|nr:homocysteine S-methyltransferase family protein [Phycisphaerae bacterium]HON90151.1 homocysteine S-methyltransferase family protein [Sedimentisphaerales bacterium]HQG49426.1 homocysteine S-methyltransferase family protein [Sedimentisphaerales bacterium]HQI28115.1 homocysteine S-methyltransferase family protein [Sedimentisphaerales bacterium]